MVTRSIVGRFLILAVLLVSLGVIAQAAIIISQGSSKRVAKHDAAPAAALASLSGSAAAATPSPAAAPQDPAVAPTPMAAAAPAASSSAPAAEAAPVRVVYPGPLGDAPIQPRKITASLTSPAPLAAPAPLQPAAGPAVSPADPAPLAAAPAAPQAAGEPAPAPTAEEAKPAAAVVASADADAQPAPAAATGHGLNLNNASVAELNAMGAGHIGQAIVQHRPYRSVEDLVKKRVIRRSIYEQIKNQVAAE